MPSTEISVDERLKNIGDLYRTFKRKRQSSDYQDTIDTVISQAEQLLTERKISQNEVHADLILLYALKFAMLTLNCNDKLGDTKSKIEKRIERFQLSETEMQKVASEAWERTNRWGQGTQEKAMREVEKILQEKQNLLQSRIENIIQEEWGFVNQEFTKAEASINTAKLHAEAINEAITNDNTCFTIIRTLDILNTELLRGTFFDCSGDISICLTDKKICERINSGINVIRAKLGQLAGTFESSGNKQPNSNYIGIR